MSKFRQRETRRLTLAIHPAFRIHPPPSPSSSLPPFPLPPIRFIIPPSLFPFLPFVASSLPPLSPSSPSPSLPPFPLPPLPSPRPPPDNYRWFHPRSPYNTHNSSSVTDHSPGTSSEESDARQSYRRPFEIFGNHPGGNRDQHRTHPTV